MKTTALRVDPNLTFADIRIDPLLLAQSIGLASLGLYHLMTLTNEAFASQGTPIPPSQKARLVELRNALPRYIIQLLDNPAELSTLLKLLQLSSDNASLSSFIRHEILEPTDPSRSPS